MKILLSGATGKMGHMITDLLKSSEQHQIVAGFAAELGPDLPYPVYLDLADIDNPEQIDVIIDFSNPASLNALLDFGIKNNLPMVIASTGYSDEQEAAIKAASEKVAILHAKNMSLGVNVMQIMVEQLASMLKNFDIEIIEKHHRYKVDSPSGTAKMLFDAANKGRADSLHALNGRAGIYDGRNKNEIGIAAIRGGTIVGEHSVIFAGEDEIIEIKHNANSRKVFANGAIQAAEFVVEQPAGFYDMDDVLQKK
ncbi:MAG TPA: 4-hydroxy-tetrahydrodipicolinate reductase [Clostridiaceae bacterium]|jgi:4-hydroxy-tetrahydrodipicolinate reductase|nr:4-hydroxy-tetrahydrodipicolinate reductase [Clostridiaceae bacterium]